MSKPLRLWNGACMVSHPKVNGFKQHHIYIAARSKAEAIRLICQLTGCNMTPHGFNGYFSECWGNSMKGIVPQLGIWCQTSYQEPPFPLHET